jgi:hypothetical protein
MVVSYFGSDDSLLEPFQFSADGLAVYLCCERPRFKVPDARCKP